MSGSNAILAALLSVPVFAALITRLRQIPISKLRTSLLFIVVIWLLLILADIVWLVAPQPLLKPLEPVNASSSDYGQSSNNMPQKSMVNVNIMKEWSLFGSFELEAVEAVSAQPDDVDLEAKETRLSLKLLGIMQSSDPSRGHAIIQHQSKSELYAVGDPIPVSRGVTLSKVLSDRVIIDNAGNFESIFLWDEANQKVLRPSAKKAAKPQKAKDKIDHRGNAELTKIASQYKQKLLADPMSMADVMRFSPSKDSNGDLQGYKVSPGRDRKNFKAFGLKSGDIITAVNGIELNTQSNAMKVYQDLTSASEASFDILRRGESLNLSISLE